MTFSQKFSKPPITSWSISRRQVFEQCKYRAALAWGYKVPDTQPKNAADRGTEVHQHAEDFVMGRRSTLVHELRFFNDDIRALRSHAEAGRVTCEEEWGFDKNWEPTAWKTAWLRLKLDASVNMPGGLGVVIDYKTGKRFGNEVKHAEQLQLYSLTKLLREPATQKVVSELWYVDQDELARFEMLRKQMTRYLGIFDKKGREITECTHFPPNPNIFTCKWCPYHPSKQGECVYGAPLQSENQLAASQPIDFSKIKKPAVDPELAAEAAALARSLETAEQAVKGVDHKRERK